VQEVSRVRSLETKAISAEAGTAPPPAGYNPADLVTDTTPLRVPPRLSADLMTGEVAPVVPLTPRASAAITGTGTLTAEATNTTAVDIAFDVSDPLVLRISTRLVAEIERHATGLRVRIVEAGPTSLRVEVYDQLRRQPAEFEAEVRLLRARLQSAARQIQEYKQILLAKEQEIDRLIVRIARGPAEPDRERLASILYCDVEGSATVEPQKKECLLSLLWAAGAMLAQQQVYMCNSWGDAVLFAFEDPNDALRGAFGLIKTLEAQGYRARAALTCGRVKPQHNLMRGRLDIIAGSVDEAARLEPAMKQLDDVSVLASEDFRKHHQLDEVAFGFEERQIRLEKPFGQRHAGERLPCYKAIDRRNL
jgi:class 3 adenylate cyclase